MTLSASLFPPSLCWSSWLDSAMPGLLHQWSLSRLIYYFRLICFLMLACFPAWSTLWPGCFIAFALGRVFLSMLDSSPRLKLGKCRPLTAPLQPGNVLMANNSLPLPGGWQGGFCVWKKSVLGKGERLLPKCGLTNTLSNNQPISKSMFRNFLSEEQLGERKYLQLLLMYISTVRFAITNV